MNRAPQLFVTPLTVGANDAALMLGISRSTFLRLDRVGAVPAPVRLRGRVAWRVCELRAWVEAGCPSRERWMMMQDERRKTEGSGGTP